MILKVENKTAQPITELGLIANESKYIWFNRIFFQKESDIRANLLADKIRFLDENNAQIIYFIRYSPDNVGIYNDPLLTEMICFLTNDSLPEEEIENKITDQFFILLRTMFKKANPIGYTRRDMAAALDVMHINTLLNLGFIGAVGTAINAMTTDAFFTSARKTKLSEICASVAL